MSEPSEHGVVVKWERGDAVFKDRRYPRAHSWIFDGGQIVRGSSSPSSVRVPLSDPSGVDPEEALLAALSSCHMLWFLDLAARAGFVVDRYEDDVMGTMGKNAQGKTAVTEVRLRPAVAFSGEAPTQEKLDELHHHAHELCFIANSVTSRIVIEARVAASTSP